MNTVKQNLDPYNEYTSEEIINVIEQVGLSIFFSNNKVDLNSDIPFNIN